MAVVVDTCGWIEWLTDGQLAYSYAPYLGKLKEVIGMTEQGLVESLTTSTALLAADLSMLHQLSFADAIIYATATHQQAVLVTSDNHFEGLQAVEYFKKTG